MNRSAILVLLCLLCRSDYGFTGERPNVVIILADDLGWGSAGCYGASPDVVRTPHIDRLARQGRRFTDACTPSSVCSPTRYALMTGRYCWRTSLISEVLGTTSPLHIEPQRLTIASMLKSCGYRCAAVGKWHLGYGTAEKCDFTKELKPGPLEIGFEYHFGVPANHGDVSGVFVEDHWVLGLNRESPNSPSPPYVPMGQRQGRPVSSLAINALKRTDDEVMATLTEKAVSWIGQQSTEHPFFLYYTPVAVHNPITPSKKNSGKTRGGDFCDFLQDLDDSVGQILDALDQYDFSRNTIVLFSSDNGGVNKQNGDTPQNVARDAGLKPVGPFRGGKHDVWEGGFRVPYLIRWPGHVPAGTVCDDTISLVDTLASLASVTDITLPPAEQSIEKLAAEDSHDVSAAWLAKDHASPIRPDLIVHSADGNFAIRKAGWKWIEGIPANDVQPASKKARAEQFQPMLFRIPDDIDEQHDLSESHQHKAQELKELLTRYREGGYSRAIPPVHTRRNGVTAELEPLRGNRIMELALDQVPGAPWTNRGGMWSAHDAAIWTHAGPKGSSLSGPIQLRDGIIEFQIRLGQANRHSLRVHTDDGESSFRVVLSHGHLEVARNPPKGRTLKDALTLARQKIRFDADDWQTVRLTFQDQTLKVQIAGNTLAATDPLLGQLKTQVHFIAFDGEVGLKQLVIAQTK